MSNMLTDVTPVLMQAFPNGKPEMSASDFDRALKFVKGRANGSVPKPGPFSMDYAWWAHTMIVAWKVLQQEWEKNPRNGPEPKFLLCPECEVMMLLDLNSGDVLMCPGGCHRAIRVNTFVELFKRPAAAPRTVQPHGSSINTSGFMSHLSHRVAPSTPGPASLSSTVPKGARPEDYGITEGVQRSKTALHGWRMWDLSPDPPWRLRSLHNLRTKDKGWPPMEPMIGTCNGADPSEILDHKCPSWEHRCGVHAVKDIPQLKRWGNPTVGPISTYVRVIGDIEMWGRVLEYAEGFRAEWAYPSKLYLPSTLPSAFNLTSDTLAEKLWETYLTEVVVDDDIFSIP